MENLLKPDFGLMFWTIVTFSLLVVLLGRFAWKPMLAALEERESRLKAEREAAESARKAAEELQKRLEEHLDHINVEAQNAYEERLADADRERHVMIETARMDAKALLEKTRKEMEAEKQRLIREMRNEVADISVLMAELILKRQIEKTSGKEVLEGFFEGIDRKSQKPG